MRSSGLTLLSLTVTGPLRATECFSDIPES
jgi:hypothetical protein